jgi:hypothetical protein
MHEKHAIDQSQNIKPDPAKLRVIIEYFWSEGILLHNFVSYHDLDCSVEYHVETVDSEDDCKTPNSYTCLFVQANLLHLDYFQILFSILVFIHILDKVWYWSTELSPLLFLSHKEKEDVPLNVNQDNILNEKQWLSNEGDYLDIIFCLLIAVYII